MADENNAFWEVMGGNNPYGIGCNCHQVVNKKGNNATRLVVDGGGQLGGEFNQIPDFIEELQTATAVAVTHCHNDHIQGFIDYVKMGNDFTRNLTDKDGNLKMDEQGNPIKVPVPIIGSAFSVSYIKGELARAKVPGKVIDNMVFIAHDAKELPELPESLDGIVSCSYQKGSDGKDRMQIALGDEETRVNVSLFDIDHSTKGSTSIGVEMMTENGPKRVLHMGDWKQEDQEHSITDITGLKDFMAREGGVDAILTDSTSTVKATTLNHEIDVRKSITEKTAEGIAEVLNKQEAQGEVADNIHIVCPCIARSANRMDAYILGVADAVLAERKGGNDGEPLVIDVFTHGGSDFTRKIGDLAAEMSDSPQYRVVEDYAKANNIEFNFHNGKDFHKKGDKINGNIAIHITTGTQADELAQLKKASMIETRTTSSLPTGDNVVLVKTQTAIPTGNNPDNVAKMENDLKNGAVGAFMVGVHSSGHASKEDSDKMMMELTGVNPEKKTIVVPIHGSESQGHLEATASGLDEKGIPTKLLENGNRICFEAEGIKYEEARRRGTIQVIEGPIHKMNDQNPFGDDINAARKKGLLREYMAYETEKSMMAKSYVLESPDGTLTTIKDCSGAYEEGEKVDRMHLKTPKNEKGGKGQEAQKDDRHQGKRSSKDFNKGKHYPSGKNNRNRGYNRNRGRGGR